jgi:hypothetical protein
LKKRVPRQVCQPYSPASSLRTWKNNILPSTVSDGESTYACLMVNTTVNCDLTELLHFKSFSLFYMQGCVWNTRLQERSHDANGRWVNYIGESRCVHLHITNTHTFIITDCQRQDDIPPSTLRRRRSRRMNKKWKDCSLQWLMLRFFLWVR